MAGGVAIFNDGIIGNHTALITDMIDAAASVHQFHGSDDANDSSITIGSWSATSDIPARILLVKSNSDTIGTDAIADDSDTVGDILWQHTDSAGFNRIAAIKVTVDDAAPGGGNRTGGQMVLGTTDGTAADITSHITLNAAGNSIFGGYIIPLITDSDGTVEGSIWYDASEDKLKFKTAAGVETITSA